MRIGLGWMDMFMEIIIAHGTVIKESLALLIKGFERDCDCYNHGYWQISGPALGLMLVVLSELIQ